MTPDLLQRLERYYDAVPRRFARVEECGPFTLFLGEPGGWVYYARPRLGGQGSFDAADVAAAAGRLRELGLPVSVEWVHETTPALLGAVLAEGSLEVEAIPLLVLGRDVPDPVVEVAPGVVVRLVSPDEDDVVAASRAVSDVGFAASGTSVGDAGSAARDAAVKPVQARVLALLEEGVVQIAVAESERDGVLATGRTVPLDGVTEVVGVATLPAARRQGLAAAVTAALVADVRARGIDLVFLTAGSAEVARVYERVGFRWAATGYAAEPTG